MQTLKPIYDHDSYSAPVAKAIYDMLYTKIFAPLVAILEIPKQLQNANTTALEEALRTGKMHYESGFFIGKLNVAITKQLRGIGATYNKTKKAYKLDVSALPISIKVAIAEGNQLSKSQLAQIEAKLNQLQKDPIAVPDLEPFFGDTVSKLGKQFHATTKKVDARSLEIPLDPNLAKDLKEAYTMNLDYYIKEWNEEAILRLKRVVHQNVATGFRAEKLIEGIIAEKGVNYNKAKFLAKQETSLMVSKYREIRYEEVGIRKYIWSTSHDSRVRHDHRELQGKVFDFNHPPVVDTTTMRRANPGEDYGCRCVAIPVLSDKEALLKNYANV